MELAAVVSVVLEVDPEGLVLPVLWVPPDPVVPAEPPGGSVAVGCPESGIELMVVVPVVAESLGLVLPQSSRRPKEGRERRLERRRITTLPHEDEERSLQGALSAPSSRTRHWPGR